MATHKLKRLISLILLIPFLFSSASFADRNNAVPGAFGNDKEAFVVPGYDVPLSLGEVKEFFRGTNGKTIIHLQDAHCNYFAQHSIAGIIRNLRDSYNVDLVFLEGGAGRYDLSVFDNIGSPEIREKVSDYFVTQGQLNGAEYYAANSAPGIELFGIEDAALYKKNLELYRYSVKYSGRAEECLRVLEESVAQCKKLLFCGDLLELDAKKREYKEKRIDLKSYITFLSEKAVSQGMDISGYGNIKLFSGTVSREKKIDFNEANRERKVLIEKLKTRLSELELENLLRVISDYRKKDLTDKEFYGYLLGKAVFAGVDKEGLPELARFYEYTAEYSGIRNTELFKEIDSLERYLYGLFSGMAEQAALVQVEEHAGILKDLFSVSLVKDKYDYFKSHRESFRAEYFLGFFRGINRKYGADLASRADLEELDLFIEAMEDFFECAMTRDSAFLKNIEEKFESRERGNDVAVLVTGGFHADNLSKILKGAGYSYVGIVPAVRLDGDNPYFRLLADGAGNMGSMIGACFSLIAVPSMLSELGIAGKDLFELSVKVRAAIEEDPENGIVLLFPDKGYFRIVPEGSGYAASEFREKIGVICDKAVYAVREGRETAAADVNITVVDYDRNSLTYRGHQAVIDLFLKMAYSGEEVYPGLSAHSLEDLPEWEAVRKELSSMIGSENTDRLVKLSGKIHIGVITGRNKSLLPWKIGSYSDIYGVNISYAASDDDASRTDNGWFINTLFHELNRAAHPGLTHEDNDPEINSETAADILNKIDKRFTMPGTRPSDTSLPRIISAAIEELQNRPAALSDGEKNDLELLISDPVRASERFMLNFRKEAQAPENGTYPADKARAAAAMAMAREWESAREQLISARGDYASGEARLTPGQSNLRHLLFDFLPEINLMLDNGQIEDIITALFTVLNKGFALDDNDIYMIEDISPLLEVHAYPEKISFILNSPDRSHKVLVYIADRILAGKKMMLDPYSGVVSYEIQRGFTGTFEEKWKHLRDCMNLVIRRLNPEAGGIGENDLWLASMPEILSYFSELDYQGIRIGAVPQRAVRYMLYTVLSNCYSDPVKGINSLCDIARQLGSLDYYEPALLEKGLDGKSPPLMVTREYLARDPYAAEKVFMRVLEEAITENEGKEAYGDSASFAKVPFSSYFDASSGSTGADGDRGGGKSFFMRILFDRAYREREKLRLISLLWRSEKVPGFQDIDYMGKKINFHVLDPERYTGAFFRHEGTMKAAMKVPVKNTDMIDIYVTDLTMGALIDERSMLDALMAHEVLDLNRARGAGSHRWAWQEVKKRNGRGMFRFLTYMVDNMPDKDIIAMINEYKVDNAGIGEGRIASGEWNNFERGLFIYCMKRVYGSSYREKLAEAMAVMKKSYIMPRKPDETERDKEKGAGGGIRRFHALCDGIEAAWTRMFILYKGGKITHVTFMTPEEFRSGDKSEKVSENVMAPLRAVPLTPRAKSSILPFYLQYSMKRYLNEKEMDILFSGVKVFIEGDVAIAVPVEDESGISFAKMPGSLLKEEIARVEKEVFNSVLFQGNIKDICPGPYGFIPGDHAPEEFLSARDMSVLRSAGVTEDEMKEFLGNPPRTNFKSLGFGGNNRQADLIVNDFEGIIKEKALKGEKLFTIYQVGLGEKPVETAQIMALFIEAMGRALKPGECKGWKLNIMLLDFNPAVLRTALSELFRISDMLESLRGSGVKIEIGAALADALDEKRLREIGGGPAADYIFNRNVSYCNLLANEGRLSLSLKNEDRFMGKTDTGHVLNVYITIRNILKFLAKPGTRYVCEEIQYNENGIDPAKVLFIPGASVIKHDAWGDITRRKTVNEGTGVYNVTDPRRMYDMGIGYFIENIATLGGAERRAGEYVSGSVREDVSLPGSADIRHIFYEKGVFKFSAGPLVFMPETGREDFGSEMEKAARAELKGIFKGIFDRGEYWDFALGAFPVCPDAEEILAARERAGSQISKIGSAFKSVLNMKKITGIKNLNFRYGMGREDAERSIEEIAGLYAGFPDLADAGHLQGRIHCCISETVLEDLEKNAAELKKKLG
ncbi:MAG: hypothetical protein ABH883_02675, partial [Candidatus Omnitrophota bacterium]